MPHRLRKVRVLVADSSPTITDLMIASLRGIGVGEIARAMDSNTAEKILANERVDAAILGFSLKPRNLAELALRLRRSTLPNAHTPIIGIAGAINEHDVRYAALAGVNKVLRIPVSGKDLQTRLIALLDFPLERGSQFEKI